jgi:hypothetical protein
MSKRHLLVWFHSLTSIGWMTLALCLAVLLIYGRSHGDRLAVLMAQVLDKQLLQHLGTASAFSGFMLCALNGQAGASRHRLRDGHTWRLSPYQ